MTTGTTVISLISVCEHCWLSFRQYAFNTLLIVDESFVLPKRKPQSIETISSEGEQVRLHTNVLCSIYSSLMLIAALRENLQPLIVSYQVSLEAMSPTGYLILGTQ